MGWSSIPAAIPTYLRIREVQKRAVELIMNLDVHKLEIQRQRLQDQLDQIARDWRNLWEEMERTARRSGGRTEGLPQRPTILPEALERTHLLIAEKASWVPLPMLVSNLRTRAAELNETAVPQVGAEAEKLTAELAALNRELEILNRRRIESYKAKQLKDSDVSSLERRVKSLTDDLQKNQDVQKIQRYSGALGELTPDRCPTCEQSLRDTLLSQEIAAAVMPIEDNIEYIRSQLSMFQDILVREREEQARVSSLAANDDRELSAIYSRIRTIRSDLVSPTGNPSAAAIEERVRTEARIRELEALQGSLDDTLERMRSQGESFGGLTAQMVGLSKTNMSELDREKLAEVTRLLRQQASEFGFSTFAASELTIDEDTYRPQKEGYESASRRLRAMQYASSGLTS